MGGVVVVKGKKARIPTAKQNAAVLASEEASYDKGAQLAIKTKVPADEVSLGQSGAGGLEVYAMFPATLTIKAGTIVKFFMSAQSREVHTATFGPQPVSEYPRQQLLGSGSRTGRDLSERPTGAHRPDPDLARERVRRARGRWTGIPAPRIPPSARLSSLPRAHTTSSA